jgi:membrane protease YdiL (CAAX protease family)
VTEVSGIDPADPTASSFDSKGRSGLAAAFLVLLGGVFVQGLFGGLVAGTEHRHDFAAIVVGFVALWGGLGGGYALARRNGSLPPAVPVGSNSNSAPRSLGLRGVVSRGVVSRSSGSSGAMLRGVAFVVIGFALQYAVTLPYRWLPIDQERVERPAKELVARAGKIGPGFAVLCVATVVGAPLVEEWFFRWVLHGALRRRFAVAAGMPTVAVILSSAVFAGIHFQPLLFPALFVFGAVCAVVREVTNRYWSSVAIHAGFNLATMITLGVDLARRS